MVISNHWATEIRMSKPGHLGKLHADGGITDSERNGADSLHEVQQNKGSPFSLSPKHKDEECGDRTPSLPGTPTSSAPPTPQAPPAPQQPPTSLPQTQLLLAGSQLAGLTALLPAQQQMLLQQAQLLAAAVQQSNAIAAASASQVGSDGQANAANQQPPQLALSQPIHLTAQDIQQLLQLQQLVLVPGHHLQSPTQFLLPQAGQGQQGLLSAPNLFQLPQQGQGNLLTGQPRSGLSTQAVTRPRPQDAHILSHSEPPSHPEEPSDLEELEQFARTFKQRRIKLGFTQGDVGLAMGKLYGNDFSQTTISRFEALNLSFKNMCKLKPLLQKWLSDAETMSVDSTLPSPNPLNSPGGGYEGLPGRRRKKRTSIETNVRYALEKSFIANQKPTSEEILLIAEQLNMEKEVIRVWFCNRRQKEKRINPCSSMPLIPSQGKSQLYGGHLVSSPVSTPMLTSQASSILSTTVTTLPSAMGTAAHPRPPSNTAPSATPPPSNSTSASPHSSIHSGLSLPGLSPNTGGTLLGVSAGLNPALMAGNPLATIQALTSGGSLPLSGLDASCNLILASGSSISNVPSLVSPPLFLNPGGLPLLGSSLGRIPSAGGTPSLSPSSTTSSAEAAVPSLQHSPGGSQHSGEWPWWVKHGNRYSACFSVNVQAPKESNVYCIFCGICRCSVIS
uniref:POU domain protein n=1 Tax=Leptobrachium leishanense TaxID=445787 RepID=A0A8C5PGN8_9ANUR